MIEWLEINLRWLAIFQISLMIVLIQLSRGSKKASLVYLLFATSILCYLIKPLPFNYQLSSWLTVSLEYVASFIPLILLRVCILTVSDGSSLPRWFKIFLLGSLSINTFIIMPLAEPMINVVTLFSMSLQFFCLVLSGFLVARLFKDYKVNPGLKYRAYFNACLFFVSLLIFVQSVNLYLTIGLSNNLVSIFILSLTICVLIFFSARLIMVQDVGYGIQLWFDKNIEFAGNKPLAQNAPSKDQPKLPLESTISINLANINEQAKRFRHDIKKRMLYTDLSLKLRSLAHEVGLSENKCRTFIIDDLGYKNFNQFINALRIEDAKARIIDDPRRPFLSISLDVGFKSVSAFNLAFQKSEEMTPTQFRAENFAKQNPKST